MSILTKISKFSGKKIDYQQFRRHIIAAAAHASTIRPRGLIGKLLSAEEVQKLFPGVDISDVHDPGSWPDFLAIAVRPIEEENALEALAHNERVDACTTQLEIAKVTAKKPPCRTVDALARMEEFKALKSKFEKFKQQEKEFTNQLHDALDDRTKRLINDTDQGIANKSLQQIFTQIDANFNQLGEGDISEFFQHLSKPIRGTSPEDMRDHIERQKDIHALCKRHHEDLPERTKIREFAASLSIYPIYQDRIKRYFQDVPSADRNFSDLTEMIIRVADMEPAFAARTTTVSSAENFAAAATTNKHGGTKTHERTKRKREDKPPATEPPLYCWSHGYCFHKGKDCLAPINGHQGDATSSNKMGGETRKWSQAKQAQKQQKISN
jgi:hypothetical protein